MPAPAGLDVQMRVKLAQQPHLAVFARYKRLLHGGQFHVKVELRQVEIGREGFQHRPVGGILDGKTPRFIFPGDAVKIQQVGEHFLALMGELFLPQRYVAGRDDAESRQLQPHLKL
jgi:hypothetical protein